MLLSHLLAFLPKCSHFSEYLDLQVSDYNVNACKSEEGHRGSIGPGSALRDVCNDLLWTFKHGIFYRPEQRPQLLCKDLHDSECCRTIVNSTKDMRLCKAASLLLSASQSPGL